MRPRMRAGEISAIYIGAFIDATPIPKPPIILKITKTVTDSGNRLGRPEPYAEIVKSIAEIINDLFLPILILNFPEVIAPIKQPKRPLPTTQPFKASLNSKYLLK